MLAFGVTLIFAGLVTSASVTVVGALLSAVAAVGWFRDVLPEEALETVRVSQAPCGADGGSPNESRAWTSRGSLDRARLPLEIYPVSAGIKGGLAGGVVMALLAMAYGIVSGTSIWYPINLLAAGFFPGAVTLSTSEIAAFHAGALLIASVDSPAHVAARRPVVRRDAAHAAAPADRARRPRRADRLVRAAA